MFEYIERKRKTISVLLGLLLIVLGVFFAYMSLQVINFQRGIEATLEHRQEEMGEFVDMHIEMKEQFLETIETSWKSRLERYELNGISEEQLVQDFIDYDIERVQDTAQFFLIAVKEGGDIIYEEYELDGYADVDVDAMTDRRTNRTNIIEWEQDPDFVSVDSELENFGERNRLVYTSEEQEGPVDLVVYVGFLEQEVFNQFIDTLDVDRITELEKAAGRSLIATLAMVAAALILGLTLLSQIFGLGKSFKGTELNEYYAFMLLSQFVDEDEELEAFVQKKIDREEMGFKELMQTILEFVKEGEE